MNNIANTYLIKPQLSVRGIKHSMDAMLYLRGIDTAFFETHNHKAVVRTKYAIMIIKDMDLLNENNINTPP